MIIAKTVPGKGFRFMEGDYRWHGNPPGKGQTDTGPAKEKQGQVAIDELHRKEARERGDWYAQHKKLKPLHTK